MRLHHPVRTILLATLGLVVPVAACGGDDASPSPPVETIKPPATTAAPTTAAPTSTAPATTALATSAPATSAQGGYAHPDGADDVVVSIAFEGGFLPVELAFTQLPMLLVTGDGRQFGLDGQTAIYPGPLLPSVHVIDIGEGGVQSLLQLADDHGLLAERTYDDLTNVADAPDTVVTISVDGETFVHRAHALGIEAGPDDGAGGIDEARVDLQAFVAAASTPTEGQVEPFVADSYLVRSFQVDDLSGFELEPTVVPWPLDDVSLADAGECVEIDAASIGDAFVEANQLTFFEQDGTVYQLAAKPQLPGDGC